MISFPWKTAAFRHQPWGLEMIWFSCEAWQTEWRTARLAERCGSNPTPAKTWRNCQRWWTKTCFFVGKWMDLYDFLYISLWHCPLNHFFCSLSHLRDAKKLLLLQFLLFFPTVWKWLDLVSRPCDGPWCAANFMRDEDFWDIVIAMSCPALHAYA